MASAFHVLCMLHTAPSTELYGGFSTLLSPGVPQVKCELKSELASLVAEDRARR